MGKVRKGARSKIQEADNESVSSDGNNFDDEIDTFYQERDDNLRKALAKTTKNKKSVSWAMDDDDDEQNGRDEVLAFDDEGSMDSDDENEYQQIEDGDEEEDEDLSGAWGSSRKAFYNEDANVNDEDAQLEEQEAIQIQKKYYEMLGQTDFGLDLFQPKLPSTSTNQNLNEQSLRRHIILPTNLLELSSNDRLQLIRDQSPELEIFCNELKNIFDDLKIYLLPLIQLVIDTSSIEEFQTYSGWQFVLSILELYLTYCSYLSLYLMMKSKDVNFSTHPILNDIEQYRKLCQLVDDDFQSMKSDLLKLCELLQERKREKAIQSKPHLVLSQQIAVPIKSTNGIDKKPSLRERMIKRREEKVQNKSQIGIKDEDEDEDEEEDKPQKRRITYEIEKNKGLTVKRKKENRNPRVRHRAKYAKALIKRKSRVPTARSEEDRYIGEPTGIRAGIKRGIKLKS